MLEWIISSAVLIAIVIVLRLILKGKMSLRLQYALWAIVLLRLLIPFSFGSAGMSVQNVIARPTAETSAAIDWEKYLGTPHVATSDWEKGEVSPPVEYGSEHYPVFQTKEEYDKYSLEDHAEMYGYEILHVDTRSHDPSRSTVRVAQPLTVNEILNIVWASGAGLIALWLLITNLHFYRKLRRSRKPLEVEHAPLRVFVTDKIDTPCLFGLIRPKIYVTPEVAADETALRYSIEHEATHRRHGDHVWSLLRGLCLAVHWYNPLVWVAAILSRRDAELACDEATIKRIGEEHRADYGRTLLQLTCEKRPALFVAATTMTGSGRGIKERIKLIVKKPKTAVITLIAIVLIVAIAVGCTFTGAKTETENECSVTLVKDQSYFSDFEVVDGQVSFDCVLCLRNAAEEPQTVCIYGNFDEDRQNGLVRENVLMAQDRSNQSSLEFCVPAGAEETFSVRFTGTFAGNNEKQNRLLPELEIVLSSETTPAFNELGKLDVSDIPALLDAIDLNEATLTRSGEEAAYPASAAIGAERYLEEIKQYAWKPFPSPSETPDYEEFGYRRLTTPHTTITFCGTNRTTGWLVQIETDDAEGWFLSPTIEGDDPWSGARAGSEMDRWYEEAEGAVLFGGEGRLLTAEELEFFRDYALCHSAFFTSHYSDVRDMNAWRFLRYFSGETFEPENEAERQILTGIKLFNGDTLDYSSPEGIPAVRIHRSDVDAYLTQYAGVTVEEMHTNWFEDVSYLPETDCFYIGAVYTGSARFYPAVGVQNGSTVTLWARGFATDAVRSDNPFDRLTLEKNGDGWRILSYTAEGEESGYSVPTSEPDEPPAELTADMESLCGSGDASLTLFLADIGEWGTYTGDAYTDSSLRQYIRNYNWTRVDAPTTEPSDYWLTAVSADGTKRMTFWDDGGAGTVEYSDGSSSSFWKASRVYPGGMSVAEYVRSQFDRLETDFSRVSFRIDGTAEDAAEYFATTAVGEHMRSLEPGNGFGADDYEVIEWRVIEVSEDGKTVKGAFSCSFVPRHPESVDIRAGNTREGTGRYAGKLIFDRTFVLELQGDGNWHCVEIGTG